MTSPVKLAGSEVVVFGGSGFVGRHLVQRLATAGALVRVAVRNPHGAAFLKPLGDVGQVVPVAADITDDDEVAAAVAGTAAVVNLVGILFESGRYTFEEVHHQGAKRIARAAAAAGVRRLVHVSAIGASKTSDSDYARTKAAGEAAVLKAFPQATVVRPSIIFGPEDNFFNLFAAVARLSPVVPVFGCAPEVARTTGRLPRVEFFGRGGPRFQPVYVGDVAEAIVKILEDPGTEGKRYELGGPKVYSFKELMDLLLALVGRRRLLVPVPFLILDIDAAIMEFLRLRLITRDQVRLLRRDNVVSKGALTLADLGIAPKTPEIILPTYLDRFRRRRVGRTSRG